jgi:hypothetical protein
MVSFAEMDCCDITSILQQRRKTKIARSTDS